MYASRAKNIYLVCGDPAGYQKSCICTWGVQWHKKMGVQGGAVHGTWQGTNFKTRKYVLFEKKSVLVCFVMMYTTNITIIFIQTYLCHVLTHHYLLSQIYYISCNILKFKTVLIPVYVANCTTFLYIYM